MSELAPKMEKPLEDAKMTMDDFAASIGEDAKTVGEELEKASVEVQMTAEERMQLLHGVWLYEMRLKITKRH